MSGTRMVAGAGLVALMALLPGRGAAQGWIEQPPLPGVGFMVEKVRSEVSVRIQGRVAQVEVSEWFRNDGRRLAEGHYLYPLPGEAVFQGFSLFQGDAELRGEIMDAESARAIYEEIVRRRADPALIELAGHGLLRARIFPIEPGQERKVTLRYTQLLSRAGRSLQFLYAGALRGRPERHPHGRSEAPARPEAAPLRFELVAEEGGAFLEPFSPTHALAVERAGGRLTVRVEDELVGRLSLFLPLAGEAVGLSVVTHRPAGEDGYVMLTLSPGRPEGRAQPRDVTAVVDVSGSMSGEKIAQARAALRFLLETLSPEDRFRLVAFSNGVRIHSEQWRAARGSDLADARRWVDGLVADGGTNIGAALDEAFRLESPGERLPVMIFLTDGLPTVGEQSPEKLADRAGTRAGRTRIFAFGVGHDVNTHLLDRLGEAGRGTTDYVEPGEDVERAVGLLAAKIRHPVLTDLEIAGAPVELAEIYPVRLPDIFSGQELVLFGRYRGSGEGDVRVRGRRAGEAASYAAGVSFPANSEANAYLPRLWASRKLGHLMRQLWTEGETESLREEIRAVALRYGLPSPYTAYLVDEPDAVAAQGFRAMPAAPVSRTAAATAASGAGAVRQAEEARARREVSSMDKLIAAEMEMQDRADAVADGVPRRVVAGRLFLLEDGVWTEAGAGEGDVVRIRAFGSAYFRLLDTLPELRLVLRELTEVKLAGRDVVLHIGSEGADEMSDARLAGLVGRYRAHGAP